MRREILNAEQTIVKEARKMFLYKEKIKTKYREIRLEDVLDISYKNIGDGEGILYLHTNQGVFPFMVSMDPKPFIESYFKLVNGMI
ncbi:hypothetical protein [Paenibacillus catalpae]|uniref:hypothetical protein n=1 Tax=Paenibacillus catalpae TaxID=1045775 RepID=UPI001FE27862|nr:hypothetical protein [Paenibacillus catalpae]